MKKMLALTLLVASSALAQTASIQYTDLAFPTLPFVSHWVEVNGAKMHYLEAGDPRKDTVVLLHGIPTWSYQWRKVIPKLAEKHHVIAPDLIGFGRSDRPLNLGYSFLDHAAFLEGFMKNLDLKNVTLVVHDLGSVVGFHYAATHQDNVRAMAFMEAALPPMFPPGPQTLSLMGEGGKMFQAFLDPVQGHALLEDQNVMVEGMIPQMTLRKLSEAEMNAYRAPFPRPEDRKPIWAGPQQFVNPEAVQLIQGYIQWMETSEMPFLQFRVTPGFLNPEATAIWAKSHLKHLTTVDLGPGLHFVPEDHGEEIAEALNSWLKKL
ncbi:haloalkane dehalogenase [Deinococcus roseus]|uniref:Haloalkane dehalogenase n=1 Tax=Deinococcus roseus TaxID=392414 RepID=A0ABQ2DI00_9DEIO|nr:haloalkane dehalogenase [Deinococcus roseus]GGJ55487.1 haloalkane dehalogenase [Deinococcus roseus]